ncbi:hypothetical protein K7432_009475 [Basidiobolus ranarum]|uniref:Uncharacterized protein n=1 Tax=Basidiobolus ranarum TaxID=34480 RepID=A0ABR2VX05_9FUNG
MAEYVYCQSGVDQIKEAPQLRSSADTRKEALKRTSMLQDREAKIAGQLSTLKKPKHWTRFKWILLFANTLLISIGICSLVLSVLTWFKLYLRADVILVISGSYVILVTTVSCFTIVIGALGYLGIFFNNRKLLTFYCILLWPLMAGIASVGYVTYRRQLWNLEAKLQSQWRVLNNNERQRIQIALLWLSGQNSLSSLHQQVFSTYHLARM